MESIVLENITGEIKLQSIAQQLRVEEAGEDYERLKVMVIEAQTIAKPKAFFKVSYIDERGEDYVVIEGVRFNSKILAVNLEGVHRIYPFVATCGAELQKWSAGFEDIVENFWADHLKEVYLRSALKSLYENIQNSFKLKKIAVMNPGSLQDWPLTEQKKLFTILGETDRLVGVKLTDSSLMVPSKSVSGIYFPTEVDYENCQLCPRENCPGRRAPFHHQLLAEKYLKK
jgi:hypothetical protein